MIAGSEMLLFVAVLAPFAAAIASLALGRTLGRWTGLFMVASAVIAFWATLSVFPTGGSSPLVAEVSWLPSLGVGFRLRADGFGAFFALLVSGVGTLVGIYSLAYVPELEASRLGRYSAALSAFMGSMLGIALADDAVVLFVFWEMTSIASFVLIGFWYEREDAKKGALQALQVTALGGLALMAGFVLIGLECGTFVLSELAEDPARREALTASPLGTAALLLVLAGAFTKSAQVPFHFWLPNAMVAPTPVSTYLHAATMVKAGIFLLARVLPLFSGLALWGPLLVAFGLTTYVLGAVQAFREYDLKGILARTTLSALGLLTMLYGLGAADQDALQIASHAAYKGALFLVVGIVEHATHTRDLRELGGLRRSLPITFGVCVVAAISMAGLPPLLGFAAKEVLYAELLETASVGPAARWFVIASSVLANAFTFAVSCRLVLGIFLGDERTPTDSHSKSHGESMGLWGPAAVLAGLALLGGLSTLGAGLEHLANACSSDPDAHLHVRLLPTHAGPVVLSVVTIALGIAFYRERDRLHSSLARLGERVPSSANVWDEVLAAITRFAETYSDMWQNGSIRWYFSGTLLFFVGVVAFSMGQSDLRLDDASIHLRDLTWPAFLLAVLLMAASVTAVRAKTRLGAAIALTSIGYLVALEYVIYRSPDILLTQILIETVSTIFLLLVLYFLPQFRLHEMSPGERAWNLGLSGLVGTVMFVLTLLATSPEFRETRNLAAEYLARSLSEAGGRNAVNVIIVDFRAMDTTGEITVLVVVGLCVFGLLRARREST